MATSGKVMQWQKFMFGAWYTYIPPTVLVVVTGLYPLCADKLHSLE